MLGAPRAVGPYQVVRELGRGGMGLVLEVRHPDVPRPLALKLILDQEAEGAALARFGREAQLLARVRHPNVVVVHQLGRAPEGPYLVTELVEGEALDALVRRGPLEPGRAARIARALADALVAVHAEQVLHRDLKPQNVILRADDDSPVLLDFGLARELGGEQLTQTGTTLGTPAYMSPEQAGGDSTAGLDARTDVYGLGAVLFALLGGRAPFEGSALQVLKGVLRDEPRWPDPEEPPWPAPLEAIVRKAMAKERMLRYRSASELRDDLDRFLAGEAVEAPMARQAAGRARALLAAALALGGAALLGLAAVALGGSTPADVGSRPGAPVSSEAQRAGRAATREPTGSDPQTAARGRDAISPSGRVHLVLEHPTQGMLGPDDPLPAGAGAMEPRAAQGAFLADGRVVTYGGRFVALWTGGGEELARWELEAAKGVAPLRCFALDAARAAVHAATAGGALYRIELDHPERDPQALPTDLTAGLNALAYVPPDVASRWGYPDGALAIAGQTSESEQDTAWLYAQPGPLTRPTALHQANAPIWGIRVTPQGALVFVSGGAQSRGAGAHEVAVYLPGAKEPLLRQSRSHQVRFAAVRADADGERVAVGTNSGELAEYDLSAPGVQPALYSGSTEADAPGSGGFLRFAHGGTVRGAAYSPDGALLYSISGDVEMAPSKVSLRVWDAVSRELLTTRPWPASDGHPVSLALSPDGSLLLIGTSEARVELWSAPRPPF